MNRSVSDSFSVKVLAHGVFHVLVSVLLKAFYSVVAFSLTSYGSQVYPIAVCLKLHSSPILRIACHSGNPSGEMDGMVKGWRKCICSLF